MKTHLYLPLLALLILVAGCGRTESAAPPAAAAPQLPADLLVTSIEGEAIGPIQARQQAEAGDTIIITGHIGGRAEPFVSERAMFTLVDTALPMCADCCDTPWDMCCETPEDIAASVVTVQVVDAEGKVVRTSLQGPDRLAKGLKVVIAGTVHQLDSTTFIVNAHQITPID